MKLFWLTALGCLSLQLAVGHPVADPTQETLVIARSEDTSTEPELAATTELTTDEPLLPIKLTEMEVNSVVSLRYAHTAVVARVKNPAKRAQEANFRVLLPETAFISGFIMTIDGKSYKAYVKEKEEAKQIYDDAVSHGWGAAHVTAKARDSNQFVVSVNVEPSSSAVFNLTYEELLVRRNGVYNHAINLHPGSLVPKLSVTLHIKEAQKITDLRVPEIRTGNEIDATKDDVQNSLAVITRGHDDREATITFTPDLDEQKRLMQIYTDKSKESASNTHRWYSNQDEESKRETEGVLGQFVVQYDVDRPKDGEILVNDGYFVHFFAPTSLPPLCKYVVFVLDTSGSMMDRKIVQLREAMQTILAHLNSCDYFSVVEFASSVTIHELKEADEEPPKRNYYSYMDYDKKPALVAPSPATPENIAKAKVIISRLDASGGTNIASALDVAVNLIHKRSEWGQKTPTANGTAEPAATTLATVEPSGAEVFDAERMKTLEPIIIFLTDGDPTVGETSPTTIINRLTEKNFGEDKATIFSLAFGEDADRKFLRKLSLRNDGFMRHIYEAADAALQLQDFYRQVSSPLLADVKFTYPGNQVKEGSVTKNKFRTFYAGSEVVVAGEIAQDAAEITPQVSGFCGVKDGFGKKRYEKLPKAPVPAKRQEYLPLERLWSYLTIKQLLDEKDASDGDNNENKENTPEKKALALALKYEFVTPLTSLVVVKPNATKEVDAESVDKPNNQPYSSYGFGAPLSINSPSAFPARPVAGFGYAPGLPGVPPPLAPQYAFAGPALSQDTFAELEETEDYELHEASSNYNYGSGLSLRARYPSYSTRLASANIGKDSYISSNMGYSFRMDADHTIDADVDYTDSSPSLFSTQNKVLAEPFPSTTRPSVVSTTENSTPASGGAIQQYHLQEFSWTESLLNASADALLLRVNDTDHFLKLTKDAVAPRASGGDAPCAVSTAGSRGVCVYLTRCDAAKHITADSYKSTFCSFDGYAGVCCSAPSADKPADAA